MARDVYDSLNEQLTSEIPQLIDLRVPYLDPSFEALVKIQLRCELSVPTAVIRQSDRYTSLRRGVFAYGPGTAISRSRHS
jgi:hypothetical protein